jgi:hypothetical protein
VYIAHVKRFAEKFAFRAVILLVVTQAALATNPTWAKKAVAFPSRCDADSNGGNENASPRTALAPAVRSAACKAIIIPSPDGRSKVEVAYKKVTIESDYPNPILQAYLRVTAPRMGTHDAALPDGFQNIDLLWSPDSRAFFVNGGNGGGYWGFWVYVYLADDPTKPRDLTEAAQRDMQKQFPPCKAAYPNGDDPGGCKTSSRPDLTTCAKAEAKTITKDDPEFNLAGIDWVNASTLLVMAEVPCSSSRGGIMCQIMGYESEIPTGRILKRVDAKQLKLDWQKSMAWDFRVPEPPLYCK